MRIAIATVQVPFIRGGAEVLAEQLRDALNDAGHTAEIVTIPFKWYPPERILDAILTCRLTDLSEVAGTTVDRVIGLKFPAYLVPHPNKVLWLAHQHRTAYDLWDTSFCDLTNFPNGAHVRGAILRADQAFIPQAKAVFTISNNVSGRLKRFCGIDSEAINPPLMDANRFYSAPAQQFLLVPSRICTIKRQALIVKALAQTREPVKLRFLGTPDEPLYGANVEQMVVDAGLSPRVEWLGRVSDAEKYAQYATALGVVFAPLDEDYGYVAVEAMLAGKPLITCEDSGGPLEFVEHGVTGLVAKSNPQSLAAAMDTLWSNAALARSFGSASRERYETLNMNWPSVLDRLLG